MMRFSIFVEETDLDRSLVKLFLIIDGKEKMRN